MVLLRRAPYAKVLFVIAVISLLTSRCGESDRTESPDGIDTATSQVEADKSSGTEVGDTAPDFTASTLDAETFRLSDYRGQFVLIDFWGTWCKPCLREIPYLNAAHQNFGKNQLQIVSIAMDNLANLKPFIVEHEMNWIHIHQNFGGPLLSLYNVTAFPTTILVDPKGTIVAKGFELRHQNLEKTLRRFILESP